MLKSPWYHHCMFTFVLHFCILRYVFVASAGEGHCSAGHAPRCRAGGTAGGGGRAAGGLARVVAWHVLWHAFGTEC